MKIPAKYQFIILLGKALHKYGVPSYKIQGYLEQIAGQRKIDAQFSDLPTWIHYVFYEDNGETHSHAERVSPGEWNLGALSDMDRIANDVLVDKLTEQEAIGALQALDKPSNVREMFFQGLGFATSAGAFSIILGTNWFSSLLATIMGILVYLITLVAKKSRYVNSTLETLSSFIVAFLVGGVYIVYPNVNVLLTILSAIIPFVPGLSITTALEEITSRSLVSGTAKLFDALTSLFKQLFGVILAVALLHFMYDFELKEVKDDIPYWINHIAVVLMGLSLLPAFRVRKKDAIWGVLLGVMAYNVTILLWPIGVLMGAFVGTLVVVIASKLISKITKTPKIVYQVQGTIMLVPGSKAFIGFGDYFMGSSNASLDMFLAALYIFMGIIGGLIFTGSFRDN